MTRGRAATPEPFDLGAVTSSDALFEALSTRRLADLSTGPAGSGDPAAVLLAALVTDVDAGAPPLPEPTRGGCGTSGAGRRGVRAVVTLGVAALVLTSAGAAAAGGGKDVDALRTAHAPVRPVVAERSNANAQQRVPVPVPPSADQRTPLVRHTGDRHRSAVISPPAEPERSPGEQPLSHPDSRPSHVDSPTTASIYHGSPGPKRPSSSPSAEITPTPETGVRPSTP